MKEKNQQKLPEIKVCGKQFIGPNQIDVSYHFRNINDKLLIAFDKEI